MDWWDLGDAMHELELPVLEFEDPAEAVLFEPGRVYVLRVNLPDSWDANGSPVEAV